MALTIRFNRTCPIWSRSGRDGRTVRLQVHFQPDSLLLQSFSKDVHDFMHHQREGKRVSFYRSLPGETQQLIHDFRDALDLRHNGGQLFLGRFLRRLSHQIFGSSENDVHGRSDFMSHTRGQRAQFSQSFRLPKLAFQSLPFRDIPKDDGKKPLFAFLELGNGRFDGKLFSIDTQPRYRPPRLPCAGR